MNMARKMAERTSGIQADPARKPAAATSAAPVTATGRLLDVQIRVNEAIDRAEVAEARATSAEASRDSVLAEATGLKEQLETAHRQLGELKNLESSSAGVVEVDISTLVEKPGRRRVLSPIEYAELRANLASNDLVHPIVYRPLGDGRNEIVSGANRVAIYRDDLGRAKILGVPFKGDAAQAELAAAFSNLLAPSLPDFEKYRQFVRLQDEFGFTRSDIIRASGLSESHVGKILAFDKLPQAAREVIARRPDRVGGNAAEEFAALANSGNAEAVLKAIESLVNDEAVTQKRALEMARPKPERAPAPSGREIKLGKRKFCVVSARNGVIGLRFAGKDGGTLAAEWAEKIEDFIRRELDQAGEK